MTKIFSKKYRLRRKGEFLRVERSGKRLVGQWVIVNMARSSHDSLRLGLTVSKKFGQAHERNRFKRVVRESFRVSRHLLPKGYDLNIRPRSGAKAAKTVDITSELLSLLSREL